MSESGDRPKLSDLKDRPKGTVERIFEVGLREGMREARDKKLEAKIDGTPYGRARKRLKSEQDARQGTDNPMPPEEYWAKDSEVEKLYTSEDSSLLDKAIARHRRRSGRGAGVIG